MASPGKVLREVGRGAGVTAGNFVSVHRKPCRKQSCRGLLHPAVTGACLNEPEGGQRKESPRPGSVRHRSPLPRFPGQHLCLPRPGQAKLELPALHMGTRTPSASHGGGKPQCEHDSRLSLAFCFNQFSASAVFQTLRKNALI